MREKIREAAENYQRNFHIGSDAHDHFFLGAEYGFKLAVEMLRSEECFQYFFDGLDKPIPDEARNVADWLENKFNKDG